MHIIIISTNTYIVVFFFSFFCAGTRQVWRGGTTGVGDYESILG